MTLWAFFSDVHGNRRALDRVEAVCRSWGVERSVCLGDVVGRGDPEGCVAWVAEEADICLVGNRDLDHITMVTPALQRTIERWPREASASDFLITHGDPAGHRLLRSSAEAKSFRGVADYLTDRGARLWLYGHTHHARIWSLGDPTQPLADRRVELDPGQLYVVNVGTAGRPFPRKGGPSMLLYEDAEDWLETVALPR